MFQRTLIVNADDFGQSAGVTRGIIEAHERGIVTSASLMVWWPACEAASAYARSRPILSVGLHVDLGEWIYHDGMWQALSERVALDNSVAVEREIRAQLERCRELLGRDPTHLDSHQHVHWREPVRSVLMGIAKELRLPLRHYAPNIGYCGDFYGQDAKGQSFPDLVDASRLVSLLHRLPDGVTELACHPGYADDLETKYRAERRVELETLCADEVRRAIVEEGIRLASFSDVQVT